MGIVLEEHGDCLPEVGEFERPDVVPIDKYFAFSNIVEAYGELEDCALPGAVRPNDDLRRLISYVRSRVTQATHAELSLLHLERYAFQGVVTHIRVVEVDVPRSTSINRK